MWLSVRATTWTPDTSTPMEVAPIPFGRRMRPAWPKSGPDALTAQGEPPKPPLCQKPR